MAIYVIIVSCYSLKRIAITPYKIKKFFLLLHGILNCLSLIVLLFIIVNDFFSILANDGFDKDAYLLFIFELFGIIIFTSMSYASTKFSLLESFSKKVIK